MTQAEVTAYVQSHLRTEGINVVLSGGAAVAIYTNNKYVSADVDLVNVNFADRKKIIAAMEKIGFRERNRYFVHTGTKHIVEFPPGTLSIGEEPIKDIQELKLSTGILRVISATDCVKDRLAAFYFWDDQQSLYQAIMVAKSVQVRLSEIKRWSASIMNIDKFKLFLAELAK